MRRCISLPSVSAVLLCALVAGSVSADSISGRVVDADGAPVPGAVVYAPSTGSPLSVANNQIMKLVDTPRAITDATGAFSVDIGHSAVQQLLVLDMMNRPAYASVSSTSGIEIVMPPSAALSVAYQKGPEPVAGQEFTAHLMQGGKALRYQASAKTDRDGRLLFNELLPGEYIVRASELVPQVGCCFTSVEVQKATVRLEEGETKALTFGGTDLPYLTGRFTDDEGDPLHGVWVRLAPKKRIDSGDVVWSAVTEQDGSYAIYDVPPDDYELRYFRRLALNDGSRVLQGSREVVVTADAPANVETGLPQHKVDVVVDLAPFMPLQPGDAAPDFEIPLLDGGAFRLADHRGKVVVLYVYSTWCSSCVESIPDFEARAKAFADTPAVFVAISLDETQADLAAFAREHRLSVPQAWAGPWEESQVRQDYRVVSVPSSYIIAPDGTLAHADLFGDYLEQEVKKLLEQ
jgi:peroxiredoxin